VGPVLQALNVIAVLSDTQRLVNSHDRQLPITLRGLIELIAQEISSWVLIHEQEWINVFFSMPTLEHKPDFQL